MSLQLPLNQMLLADKLELVESPPDSFPLQVWHRDVLNERKQLVYEDICRFLDWDCAFDDLRNRLPEHSPS